MRIVAISDIHEQQAGMDKLPDGDLLISAGDETFKGGMGPFKAFVDWFASQSHKHKILVGGNHSLNLANYNREASVNMVRDAGIIYLEHEATVIDGLKIFGSPYSSRFGIGWAFNIDRGKDSVELYAEVPSDTQVLVCHGPSHMINDAAPRGVGQYDNVGSVELTNRIHDLKQLRVFICGHIHNAHNVLEKDGVIFVNAAICDESYKPTNKPVIIDL
jgi:Icc-related predicted phosphoesterase